MLDLVALLALAQVCAPQVAPQTLAALAHVESRFDPFAIGANHGPRPARPARTAEEAARMARTLLERGANLDLGVAQINSANLDWLGLSVEDAFDPCRNLQAAARVLMAGYRPAGSDPEARQAALRIALSRYNTGDARRGFANGYVGKVETAAARLGLATRLTAPAQELTPAAPPSPSSPPPAWDVFARAESRAVLAFSIQQEPLP